MHPLHEIVADTDLKARTFDLLDFSSGRIKRILGFLSDCEDLCALGTRYHNKLSLYDFWTLRWKTKPSPAISNATLLFLILILCKDPESLVKELSKKTENVEILTRIPLQFSLNLTNNEINSTRSYDFHGPMIDFFIQILKHRLHCYKPLKIILDQTSGLREHATALHSFLVSFSIYEDDTFETRRILDCMLELGADPNGALCTITPLQIAASRLDYDAVEILLGAEADPNRLGNPTGIKPLSMYDREGQAFGTLEGQTLCNLSRS